MQICSNVILKLSDLYIYLKNKKTTKQQAGKACCFADTSIMYLNAYNRVGVESV